MHKNISAGKTTPMGFAYLSTFLKIYPLFILSSRTNSLPNFNYSTNRLSLTKSFCYLVDSELASVPVEF